MIRKITRFNPSVTSADDHAVWLSAKEVGNKFCVHAEHVSSRTNACSFIFTKFEIDQILCNDWVPDKKGDETSYYEFREAAQKACRLEQSMVFESSVEFPGVQSRTLRLSVNFFSKKSPRVPFFHVSVNFLAMSGSSNGTPLQVFFGDNVWVHSKSKH
ncbi:MAG: hypothetical protein V4524_03340 [Patescibacteria group bacterium]